MKWGVITWTADTAEAYKSQRFLEIKPLAKKLSQAVPSGFHMHIIQSYLTEDNTVNSLQLSCYVIAVNEFVDIGKSVNILVSLAGYALNSLFF